MNVLTAKVAQETYTEGMRNVFMPPSFRRHKSKPAKPPTTNQNISGPAAIPKVRNNAPYQGATQLEPALKAQPGYTQEQTVNEDPQIPKGNVNIDRVPLPLPAYNPDSAAISKLSAFVGFRR